MESQTMQWSDDLEKKVEEALAKSDIVKVMEESGVLKEGTFEIQINLVDKDYKPTTSEARGGNVSSAQRSCFVYYVVCAQCAQDGGTPIGPGPSCLCRFC